MLTDSSCAQVQALDKLTVRKYGASTTKVYAAFQIVPSWGMAVALYYVFAGAGIGTTPMFRPSAPSLHPICILPNLAQNLQQ